MGATKARGLAKQPAPEARDLPAEWVRLRAWVATHLPKLNLTGIGSSAGLTPQQAKALLNPPADASRITRTRESAERLDKLVAVLSAPPFCYKP